MMRRSCACLLLFASSGWSAAPPAVDPRLPWDLAHWPVKKQVAYLIDALKDVDEEQQRCHDSTYLKRDPRVMALIRLGDAAVPALIDAVEKDGRATKALWHRGSGIVMARDAALLALRVILRAGPVGASRHTLREEKDRVRAVARLRAYWAEYGRRPIHERLMAQLKDRSANPDSWREAANHLSRVGSGTELMWPADAFSPSGELVGPRLPRRRNPALDFDRPTAAEAVLAAMDCHLVERAAEEELIPQQIRSYRSSYIEAVVCLRDPRILPEMHRRAAKAAGAERRELADACRRLGASGPLADLVRDLARGRLGRGAGDAGCEELNAIVSLIGDAGVAEYGYALWEVAKPGHPAHAAAREIALTRPQPGWGWRGHPVPLHILSRTLEDRSPSGAVYSVRGDRLHRAAPDDTRWVEWPAALADPAVRRADVTERICDLAAERLAARVVGLPTFHAMRKDSGERLAFIRAFMGRHLSRLRPVSEAERGLLGLAYSAGGFIPDIRPLGRAATEADVRAGRAVFHLGGKGRPLTLKTPAVAEVAGESGLIVQAEAGPDGTAVYGVIFQSAIRRVEAKDTLRITTAKE